MDNMENKEIETVEAEKVEEAIDATVVEAEPVEKKKANVLAIIALIAGILGIVFACCCRWVAPVFGIAAIILAVVSPKDENGKRAGLAKAGLICGIAGTVISIALIIISIAAPALLGMLGMASEMEYYM